MKRNVGLDFGTSNSALGVATDQGVSLARFPHRNGVSETFRSVLYFHPELRDERGRATAVAGAEAIERYLEAEGSGRLMLSLKSYLADRSFESTDVFGRVHSLADLMALGLRQLTRHAEAELGALGGRVVVGRPVNFAGAETPELDSFAEGRLRTALSSAGFDEVIFEYEPVAAAYFYETRLDHDEVVLVADFGGGTSDFSLIEVGPSVRGRSGRRILGNDGLGIAGDSLDGKILHHVVAPALGLGTTFRSMFGKELTVPSWIFGRLRRWHQLSFLKTKRTMSLLREIFDQSTDREKIGALLHVLDYDLGFSLYRAVEKLKVQLSSNERARFSFEDPPLRIDREVTRGEFEGWIEEETTALAGCVDRLLARAGVDARDVDRVFMTGGTSFVPAVRRIFDARFGAGKIQAGGEMVSVATGLALRARDAS